MAWIDCLYCEGQYQEGAEHGVRQCIKEVISAHRFALYDSSDYDDTAGDIVDVLQKRGINLSAEG